MQTFSFSPGTGAAASQVEAYSNLKGPYAKRPINELSAAEAKQLLNHSPDIVCITDFSGKILWSNLVECSITGFTREELQETSMFELIHPEDMIKVVHGLNDIAVGKLNPCTEVRTRCKDGSYRWISWSGVPIPEEEKIYSIGRDVTSQKVTESMVRKLAAIVQASNEAIFGIDQEGLISSWNKGAEALYGYSSEEMLKQPVQCLLAYPRQDEDLQKSNPLETSEAVHKCKNGKHITVSVSSFPVPDDSGQIGWAAIVRDITVQKEAERSIAEFYSITSHELRTPLSSIRGVLSLLENGVVEPGSAEGQELISMARTSSERLIRLVNDILDLRRIESGSINLTHERILASDLLSSALSNVKGIAIESGIALVCELHADGKIFGDQDRLTQVITNLLSNAIKYSKSAQQIIAKIDREQTDRLRFSVIDQGPGISKENYAKLFKKFGQLDSSDTRPKEGMGLGLFIARSIVEQHNGRIGVLPAKTGGCHFWFDLEICQEKET